MIDFSAKVNISRLSDIVKLYRSNTSMARRYLLRGMRPQVIINDQTICIYAHDALDPLITEIYCEYFQFSMYI